MEGEHEHRVPVFPRGDGGIGIAAFLESSFGPGPQVFHAERAHADALAELEEEIPAQRLGHRVAFETPRADGRPSFQVDDGHHAAGSRFEVAFGDFESVREAQGLQSGREISLA